MDFGVLGPVEARRDGRSLPVGSGRERFVLGLLLVNADRLTAADRLIDALWDDPPSSAKAQLHNMISNLRRRLDTNGLIVSRPQGYELRMEHHRLDLSRFRQLAERGRERAAVGDHGQAAELLGQAASLWRGPALADVPESLAAGVRESLHEEKLAAAEARLAAELAVAHFDAVLREVPGLLAESPFRERLYEIQMTALASAGRQAEALQTYQRMYRRFVEELGIEPGASLRELEQRILRGAPLTVERSPAGRPIPRELPPAASTLTGRDMLIGTVSDAVRREPAVAVLVGPGGVGKTAVAVGCAHGLLDAFPDGTLYADLRGVTARPADPHAVLGRFLRALGVDGGNLPDDPDERISLYRSTLAGSRTLVMLDDAAGEEQVRPLLPGAAGCATLVTSRRQLAALVGATRWTVPVLTACDAVELVARIAGRDRVAAEPDAAARIAATCGFLPLATCIAAAKLAVRPDWTLEELCRRLGEERGRLDELAVGDLDVRASIALSYHTLEPAAALLFRRLGLITAPDWPAWVGDALAGESTTMLLDQLADVHLVEPLGRDSIGQSRFRLHELVAEFARERAASDDDPRAREDARRRLLTSWLALTVMADRGIPHGLLAAPPDVAATAVPAPPAAARLATETPSEWLDAERRSLVASVEEACRLGWPDLAGSLVLSFSGFLWLRSYDDDWERILQVAVAAARADGPSELLVRLLGALFESRGQRDRYAELPAIAEEQLALARLLDHRELEVRALRHAGQAAIRLGRLDQAAVWLDQAVLAARHPEIPSWLLQDCLFTSAWAAREVGAPERAITLLDEAVAIRTELGESIRTGLHQYHYGVVALELGRLDDAERALTRSMKIAREAHDELGIAYLDQTFADVAIRRSRFSRAATRLTRARQSHEKIGSGDGLAEALRSTGDLAAAQSLWPEAISWYHRSLEVWRRINSKLDTARTLARLSRAHQAQGDQESAQAACHEYEAVLAELNLDQDCLYLPQLPG